jgi:Raf kinase inhibitor-like YbhB/YbcL family protein
MNILKALGNGLFVLGAACAQAQQAPPVATPPPLPLLMTIPAYADGATVPIKFTCSVGDASVSPEIRWSQVPAATQSFVLVLVDLEAHPDRGMVPFAHWILWNIPATARSLPEGLPSGTVLADGTRQMKGRKGPIYLGPCAAPGPSGHYMFSLYALDSTLSLDEDAQRDDVMKAVQGHVLRVANWIGLFHR